MSVFHWAVGTNMRRFMRCVDEIHVRPLASRFLDRRRNFFVGMRLFDMFPPFAGRKILSVAIRAHPVLLLHFYRAAQGLKSAFVVSRMTFVNVGNQHSTLKIWFQIRNTYFKVNRRWTFHRWTSNQCDPFLKNISNRFDISNKKWYPVRNFGFSRLTGKTENQQIFSGQTV